MGAQVSLHKPTFDSNEDSIKNTVIAEGTFVLVVGTTYVTEDIVERVRDESIPVYLRNFIIDTLVLKEFIDLNPSQYEHIYFIAGEDVLYCLTNENGVGGLRVVTTAF